MELKRYKMSGIILLSLLFLILLMLVVMTFYLRSVKSGQDAEEDAGVLTVSEKGKESILNTQNFVYAALVLNSVGIVVAIYLIVRGTVWEGHLMEW